jgi:hypothetical protein
MRNLPDGHHVLFSRYHTDDVQTSLEFIPGRAGLRLRDGDGATVGYVDFDRQGIERAVVTNLAAVAPVIRPGSTFKLVPQRDGSVLLDVAADAPLHASVGVRAAEVMAWPGASGLEQLDGLRGDTAMFAGQSTADQKPGIRWLAEQATAAECLHGLTDEEMRAGDFSSQAAGLLTYLKAGARARTRAAVLQGVSAEALGVVLGWLRSAPCHINLVSDKAGVIRASVGDTAQSCLLNPPPHMAGADLSHFTKATLDEDGGETCRSILRDALQAPPDDNRPAPPGYRNERDNEFKARVMGAAHRGDAGSDAVSSAGHQPGRIELTAADFASDEEFALYKVGAAAMPAEYEVYPGSYEDSILKACAAIAVTAVNRHEARMEEARGLFGAAEPASRGQL